MPYKWSEAKTDDTRDLTLWVHQSLSPRGMAMFVFLTFALILLPLFGLLGTTLLWALLPFLMIAVGAIWFALNRSCLDQSTREILTISPELTKLTRTNPRKQILQWECNTHWVGVNVHMTSGPVPHYVTLQGNGREVEIGAFLSEEERKALYAVLIAMFMR